MRAPLAAALLAALPVVAHAALPDAGFEGLGLRASELLAQNRLPHAAAAPDPWQDHGMHGATGPRAPGMEEEPANVVPPDVTPYGVRGIDVSHYQGDIDWTKLGGAGLSFIYVKATEGGDYVDDHFASYWAAASRAGLAKGAYHFYNFCRDGASQAANFVATVPAESGTLPPVVDLEQSNDCAKLPAKAAFRRDLDAFVAKVQETYGQVPVLYVNGSIYSEYFSGDDVPYKFWIADISHKTASLPDGRAWAFWQYDWHGAVAGVPGEVDLDVFAGSLSELKALGRPAALVASLPAENP